MNRFKEDEVVQESQAAAKPAGDGIDRRNFLGCMAWAGTGLLWSMVGGVPTSKLLAQTMKSGGGAGVGKVEDFSFVQISDCHIGFNKGANPDVTGTLKKAIDRANMVPAGMKAPDFMIHTGDITQNSKAAEFDTASEVIKGFKSEVFYVPGEHDFIDDGVQYKQRFGKGTMGNGWYSYNHKGVHFVGLNNCVQVDAMGNMGDDQLKWLKSDLAGQSHSTPIVVFAHIPLWMVYEKWGWGTKDGEQALALARTRENLCAPNETDIQREEHQQALFTDMKKQLLSPSSFFRLPWIAWHAPPAIISDMSGPELLGMFAALAATGTPPTRVLLPTGQTTLPSGEEGLTISEEARRADVARFMSG